MTLPQQRVPEYEHWLALYLKTQALLQLEQIANEFDVEAISMSERLLAATCAESVIDREEHVERILTVIGTA